MIERADRQPGLCSHPAGDPAALPAGGDVVGWPAGPSGIIRANAQGKDVQKFIWTDSLEVRNFTTWKLIISPACHRNIKSNMMRLSNACPIIFWW